MTKSKIHYLLDTLYYFALVFMPALALLVVGINGGVPAMTDIMGIFTGAFADTELYNAVAGVIGADGVAPLLNANTMFMVDWIVLVVYGTAFHLLIDCLQFIPACAHRLMDKLGGEWFE